MFPKVTEPTIGGIKHTFNQFKESLQGLGLTPEQEVALGELEKSIMTATHIPPTLKREKSRGPAWKGAVESSIEDGGI